jgi:hypothetical protein
LVYDAEVAAAAMVHAFFGVGWFGVHVVTELIFVPLLTKSTKLQELAPMGRFAPRVSAAGMGLGLMTVVTGLAFLSVKFGTDVNTWVSVGETQAVLAALGVAIVSLVFGVGVLRPAALGLAKDRPATPPPADAEIPEALKPRLRRVAMYMHVQTLFVVLMLAFMVIAIEGGF